MHKTHRPTERMNETMKTLTKILSVTMIAIGLAGCAATGGTAGAAIEVLCAVHNSAEMKLLCEVPTTK